MIFLNTSILNKYHVLTILQSSSYV